MYSPYHSGQYSAGQYAFAGGQPGQYSAAQYSYPGGQPTYSSGQAAYPSFPYPPAQYASRALPTASSTVATSRTVRPLLFTHDL